MNTQQANASDGRVTEAAEDLTTMRTKNTKLGQSIVDGLKLGCLLGFQPSSLPTFRLPILLALLAVGMMAGTARGGTAITSQGTGNWEANGTWDLGRQPTAGDDVTIAVGHTVTMTTAATKTIDSLTINGTLQHTAGSTYKIDLLVTPGNVTVNGTIYVLGCGYAAGTGPSGYAGSGNYGGAHGGEGGTKDAYVNNAPATALPTRPTYDSVTNPTMAGGGGSGRAGGGVVIISCSGDVTINAPGKIIADGQDGDAWCGASGPGAGGTVNIGADQLLGDGSISANGGLAISGNACSPSGGGGGGRIAVVLSGDTVASIPVGLTLSARGANGQGGGHGYGAAGTIYLKGTGSINGSLKVANPVTLGASGAKTLLPAGTHQFDSISIDGGGAILAVGSGVTNNLDGCTVTTTGGGKVVKQGAGALNWTGTYTNTYTISQQGNGTWTLPGDLVVGTGGALTHEPRWLRTEDASSWLNIDIGSHNLTVGPGTISVAGCGDYDTSGNTYGGVHGGEGGGPRTPTYGSITNPITAGGGAGTWTRSHGGGVVVIQGTGIVTVDATKQINAVGDFGGNCGYGAGAGGSVNLRVGQLLGSGTITVKGGTGHNNCGTGGGGGGGRIAVVLSSATVASIPVTMNAEGGPASYSSVGYGAAGTIYLQGTDSPDGKGLLRISNPTLTGVAGATTLIWDDTSVGNVEVLANAALKISASKTLAVYGDWTTTLNPLTIADSTGIVEFKGTATRTISGSTTFPNFKCLESDKTLQFQDGKTQKVMKNLTLGGTSGHLLLLRSTASPTRWNFAVDSACVRVNMKYLDVKDSAANVSGGSVVTVKSSTDSGNNDAYWVFANPTNMVWTGAVSDDWNIPSNWNQSPARVPSVDDLSITIPTPSGGNPPRQPKLTVGFEGLGAIQCPLTIQAGASLNLNNYNLEVGNDVTNAGTLTAQASETLTFKGTVDFTGATFTPATSKLILNAAAAGTQTFKPDGKTFYRIEVPNASTLDVSGGGFTAAQLYCRAAGAQLNFNAGSTYAVTDLLDLRGTLGNLVKLRSSSSPTKWNLNLSGRQVVRYVDVQDSDASAGGGRTIYAIDSTDSASPSTVNWDFTNGKFWTGGSSTDWGTGANWSGNTVPGVSSYVYIDGSAPRRPQITVGTTNAGLTVLGISGAETLTVDLNSSSWLKINGDMYLGANATVTHSQNPALRVGLDVGSMTVAAGGSIYVQGRGYGTASGPAGYHAGGQASGDSAGWGGAHGGEGGSTATPPTGPTYGSVLAPVTPGGGGLNAGSAGGGVVTIIAASGVTVNGVINAKGTDSGGCSGGGAGGSVYIQAGTLAGTGTITADGGLGSSYCGGAGGGGGRIAVVLSGAAAPVGFAMSAVGGEKGNGAAFTPRGAAGTIYLQGTDSPGGNGLLRISNIRDPATSPSTLISAALMTDTSVGSVELLNQAKFAIDSTRTLSVYGSWSNGATPMTGGANYGGTVVFAGTSPNPVSVWGGNTWSNLTIATAGKTVNFEAGKTQTVYGLPTFENGVTLKSTSDDTWWWLTKGTPGSTQNVGKVYVKDSNATNGMTFAASGGSSLGHTVNWLFPAKGTVIMMR